MNSKQRRAAKRNPQNAVVAATAQKEELLRTPSKEHPIDQERKTPKFVKSHKLALEIFGAISAVVTILGFALSYAPRLSVHVSDSLVPSNPLSVVFTLSNDGLLPVHDVQTSCSDVSVENPKEGGDECRGDHRCDLPPRLGFLEAVREISLESRAEGRRYLGVE